jgi:hypothetical protein
MVLWDLFAKQDYHALHHYHFFYPFQLAETKVKEHRRNRMMTFLGKPTVMILLAFSLLLFACGGGAPAATEAPVAVTESAPVPTSRTRFPVK